MNKKVNLFVIGASKCGTTFLHNLLNQHPSIYMCPVKEPRFFQKENYLTNMKWYESLYAGHSEEMYLGESSPVYSETTFFPQVPQRIHAYNQEARILYIVRNPYDRLRSVWAQALSTGHFAESDSYGMKMPLIFRDAIFRYPPFLEACKYSTHVDSYLKYFDARNLKVIMFEDLTSNADKTLSDIFRFLGVNEDVELEFDMASRNESRGKRMYSPWSKRLRALYPRRLTRLLPRSIETKMQSLFARSHSSNLIPATFTDEDVLMIHRELAAEVQGIYQILAVDDDPWRYFSRSNQASCE